MEGGRPPQALSCTFTNSAAACADETTTRGWLPNQRRITGPYFLDISHKMWCGFFGPSWWRLPIIGHAVGPGGSWLSNVFLENRKIDAAIVRSPTKPSKKKPSRLQLNVATGILANVAILAGGSSQWCLSSLLQLQCSRWTQASLNGSLPMQLTCTRVISLSGQISLNLWT